ADGEGDIVDDPDRITALTERDREILDTEHHGIELPRIGIGGVAETVAEEVEGEHRENHEDAGDHQPGRLIDRADALGGEEQHAPALHPLPAAEDTARHTRLRPETG